MTRSYLYVTRTMVQTFTDDTDLLILVASDIDTLQRVEQSWRVISN